MKYDVFISYSRRDTAIADRICKAFDANGITYFIDRQGIGGGMEFPEVLANAILESNKFLFLASENAYESKFTNSEITFAFNEKPKESIIPYIIDNSSLPVSLRFVFSGINWRNIKDHPIESVLINDIKGMLNYRGTTMRIQQTQANKLVIPSSPNLIPFHEKRERNLFYGYKDLKDGKIIIPSIYKSAHVFCEGLAAVEKDGKQFYINANNENAIPLDFRWCHDFSCGLAAVFIGTSIYLDFIDHKGNIVIPHISQNCLNWSAKFSEDLLVFNQNRQYGYMDKNGNIAIPLQFEDAKDFKEGLAPVKHNNKWGYVDKSGNIVIPFNFEEAGFFSEGIAPVKKKKSIFGGAKWGYIDKTGREIIPFTYAGANYFSEGLAAVTLDDKKWGFINKLGKMVISPEYNGHYDMYFKEDRSPVVYYDNSYVIDKSGERLFEI